MATSGPGWERFDDGKSLIEDRGVNLLHVGRAADTDRESGRQTTVTFVVDRELDRGRVEGSEHEKAGVLVVRVRHLTQDAARDVLCRR